LAIQQGFESTLQQAKMSPNNIGLVNANASGSVRGDLVEAVAIKQVFGDTPVVAHKGNFANLGAATSIVELIGAVLAIHHGEIPPTLNCDFVDPSCQVNVITSKSSMEQTGIIKSSFSSSGQICSVIVE
jgi:3-oxoacyl-[acyl-carrier-protein] synthase II